MKNEKQVQDNINKNVSFLRKSKKLNQTQLANELDLTAQVVSNWETSRSSPTIYQLVQLANFYRISIDDIVINNAMEEG